MRILVDAHIGRLIIAAIEARGHDVLRASSFPPRTTDDDILRVAEGEQRVVMTSDKDFGELVFHQRRSAAGVILLRIDAKHESARAAIVEGFWPQIEQAAPGHFVVVTNRAVRRSPLPDPMK